MPTVKQTILLARESCSWSLNATVHQLKLQVPSALGPAGPFAEFCSPGLSLHLGERQVSTPGQVKAQGAALCHQKGDRDAASPVTMAALWSVCKGMALFQKTEVELVPGALPAFREKVGIFKCENRTSACHARLWLPCGLPFSECLHWGQAGEERGHPA